MADCKEDTKVYKRGQFANVHPDLWVIHGKYYDLTPFMDSHPGGRENMILGRGRDCTELFESVHSLSSRNFQQILKKYNVPAPAGFTTPNDIFLWQPDGFYSVLKTRVRKHFNKGSNISNIADHKATTWYWMKVTALFLVWIALVTATLQTGSYTLAFFAGSVMNMLGFNVMHDASHYGISKRPWVNRVLHIVWNDWNLWNHFIWLRHHVYAHHSYTGVFRQDPDITNSILFVRKHPNSRFKSFYKGQHLHGWLWYTLLPNQHLGQSLLYAISSFQHRIFGVPLERLPFFDIFVWLIIYLLSVYCHFVLPFYYLSTKQVVVSLLLYWTAQGIGYFASVSPNHDTIDNHESAILEGEMRDWGVQQVLSTGNHSTDTGSLWNKIVTNLWGGMNYQIEHHLFPSVSHVHYGDISKIVQQTCTEFNVKYVTHSWSTALWRFGILMRLMADRPKHAHPSLKPIKTE